MRKPSPSLAVALAALFVAVGGTAAAATGYVITSTHQIKPSVLKQLRGANGRTGATGAAGPAGIASIQDVSSAAAPICGFGAGSCDVASATATCPSGSFVVGGAANATTIETPISTFVGSTTYAAVADNASSFSGSLTVTAICATGPGLQFAARDHGAASDQAGRLAARLRSQ
jgi:hypothetical protein